MLDITGYQITDKIDGKRAFDRLPGAAFDRETASYPQIRLMSFHWS